MTTNTLDLVYLHALQPPQLWVCPELSHANQHQAGSGTWMRVCQRMAPGCCWLIAAHSSVTEAGLHQGVKSCTSLGAKLQTTV